MVEPPPGAPAAVQEMIAAGNAIATLPYIWGGGHGSFVSPGYDCSGSVSFVLNAAGLLGSPETSGMFESYGDAGTGQWVTIYANAGHVWMTIAGWRFDTVALAEDGTRWSQGGGEYGGLSSAIRRASDSCPSCPEPDSGTRLSVTAGSVVWLMSGWSWLSLYVTNTSAAVNTIATQKPNPNRLKWMFVTNLSATNTATTTDNHRRVVARLPPRFGNVVCGASRSTRRSTSTASEARNARSPAHPSGALVALAVKVPTPWKVYENHGRNRSVIASTKASPPTIQSSLDISFKTHLKTP